MGTVSALSGQLAPPLSYQPHVETWINLPVGAEDPVKAALLRSFLTEHEFDYAESPHFISIRETDARSVEAALSIWAYRGDMPEDHRHLDSLMSTLAELGDTTLAAIRDAILTSAADGTTDLDLR